MNLGGLGPWGQRMCILPQFSVPAMVSSCCSMLCSTLGISDFLFFSLHGHFYCSNILLRQVVRALFYEQGSYILNLLKRCHKTLRKRKKDQVHDGMSRKAKHPHCLIATW